MQIIRPSPFIAQVFESAATVQVELWPGLPAIKKFVWQNASLKRAEFHFFVPSAETKCAWMGVSWCTSREAPSSLATTTTTVTGWRKNEASNDLLVSWWPLILLLLLLLLLLLCLMVAATTIMLAGSRPSGVTVTAPQNEHHGTCRGDSPGWALTTTTRWFPSRPALYYF